MTQTVYDWLRAFPGFAGLEVRIDSLGPGAGCVGLFFRGQRELERREDILGNLRRRVALTVRVALTAARDPQEHSPQVPEVFDSLGRWVRDTAPVLGQEQRVRLEKAALVSAGKEGVARYEGELTLEFTQ